MTIIKWGSYLCLLGFLTLAMGCRTPQPNLKPPNSPEVLTVPPNEAKYATSQYPEKAYDRPDINRTSLDQALSNGSGKNGMGPNGGMGGFSGPGMPGGR
jgi:hypothetical protein